MTTWIIGTLVALFILALYVLPYSNTRIGRMLRESDHEAWRYAVEDKERELAELRSVEPRLRKD